MLLLHENSITEVESGTFKGLGQLLELDLSGNSISELGEGAFFGLNKLEELLLYFNNIQEARSEMWERLETLKYL